MLINTISDDGKLILITIDSHTFSHGRFYKKFCRVITASISHFSCIKTKKKNVCNFAVNAIGGSSPREKSSEVVIEIPVPPFAPFMWIAFHRQSDAFFFLRSRPLMFLSLGNATDFAFATLVNVSSTAKPYRINEKWKWCFSWISLFDGRSHFLSSCTHHLYK